MGHSGRNKLYTTWGPTAQALNGMTYTSGLPNTHPAGWGYSYMDVMAGYAGAYAVLSALYHKKQTGKGQYIDISQVETGLAFTGANLLDFTVNKRSSRRPGFPSGNRSISSHETPENSYRGRVGVPHNSYRCLGGGPNDWCTIAVFSDEEWGLLKKAMGYPEWSESSKYNTVEGRIRHQDELDAHLEKYTIKFNKHELMRHLQSHGVASAAVQTSEDLIETDLQLKERGVYINLDHPLLGKRLFEEIPINMSETPPYLHHSAPIMGADNDYVFGEILGYSQSEIDKWTNEGVLWPENMPRESMKFRQPLW
jgi:crotonobetainyl-CoA:carnitine CoA-transferase CaiB-like acyl-CoA transferase